MVPAVLECPGMEMCPGMSWNFPFCPGISCIIFYRLCKSVSDHADGDEVYSQAFSTIKRSDQFIESRNINEKSV